MKKKAILGAVAIIAVISAGTVLAVGNNLAVYHQNQKKQSFDYTLNSQYQTRDDIVSEIEQLEKEYAAYRETVSQVVHSSGIVSKAPDTKEDVAYQSKRQQLNELLTSYPIASVSKSTTEVLAEKVDFWKDIYHHFLRNYNNDLQMLQQKNPECIEFYHRSQELYQQHKNGTITVQQALDEINTFKFSH